MYVCMYVCMYAFMYEITNYTLWGFAFVYKYPCEDRNLK